MNTILTPQGLKKYNDLLKKYQLINADEKKNSKVDFDSVILCCTEIITLCKNENVDPYPYLSDITNINKYFTDYSKQNIVILKAIAKLKVPLFLLKVFKKASDLSLWSFTEMVLECALIIDSKIIYDYYCSISRRISYLFIDFQNSKGSDIFLESIVGNIKENNDYNCLEFLYYENVPRFNYFFNAYKNYIKNNPNPSDFLLPFLVFISSGDMVAAADAASNKTTPPEVINRIIIKIPSIKEAINFIKTNNISSDIPQVENANEVELYENLDELISINSSLLAKRALYIYHHHHFVSYNPTYLAKILIRVDSTILNNPKSVFKDNPTVWVEIVNDKAFDAPKNSIFYYNSRFTKPLINHKQKTVIKKYSFRYYFDYSVLNELKIFVFELTENKTFILEVDSNFNIVNYQYDSDDIKHIETMISAFVNENNKFPKNLEYDEEFNKVFKTILSKQTSQLDDERKNKAPILLEKFEKIFKDKESPILETKVNIIPFFGLKLKEVNENLTRFAISNKYYFGFKINAKGTCIVKDYSTFLRAIEQNKLLEHSKTISFVHNINSFSTQAKNILSIINNHDLNATNSFSSYKEMFPITEFEFFDIVKNSSYDTFSFTFVSDSLNKTEELTFIEDLNVDAKILASGEITTNLKLVMGQVFIISSRTCDFLLDLNKKTIQKIKFLDENMLLTVRFLIDNPLFNSSYVSESFSKKIYPHISKSLEVDETFKAKNKVKDFLIKSYIDYEDYKVVIKTSFFDGDDEVKNGGNEYQTRQIIKYNNILNGFEFKDGVIKNEDSIAVFLVSDLTSLKELSEVYISESLNKMRKIKNSVRVNINVSISGGIITSHITEAQLNEAEIYEILKAYRKNKKYVLLKDKCIQLDKDNIDNLEKAIIDFNLDEKHLFKKVEIPTFNLFKMSEYEEQDYITFDVASKVKDILEKIKNYKKASYVPAANFVNTLYNFQLDGYKWLKVLYNNNLSGILADDMGLGKTIQMLAMLSDITSNKPILIVCPKGLVFNWKKEFEKFNVNFEAFTISGNKPLRDKIISTISGHNAYIISYDSLRNDSSLFENIEFDTVVLDEAQYIKNITAQKSVVVKKLKSDHKFVLSGTPVENSLLDLWSIMDFLMPGYLYTHQRFLEIQKGILQSNAYDINLLVNKTKPFILRRNKEDVLKELPPKTTEIIYCELNQSTPYYKEQLLKAKQLLEADKINHMNILASITKLRQICLSPKLLDDDFLETSEKIDISLELIKQAISNDHKVVVFSSFVKGLNALATEFDNINIKYFMLTGDTSGEDRLKYCDIFNNYDSKERVFLVSLKSGGVGLNLTGADIVIHLNPWWNLASENQATDRTHRIGQERPVTVYKLIISGTIEEKIIELQNRKKELSDLVINGDTPEFGFTDYRYLLE